MDSKDIRNLQEAYMEVYQELDEEERPLPYGRMMKKSDELADSDDKKNRKRAAKIYLAANAPKGPKVKVRKEQVDLYDIILSHLLDEGYAETLEAAESIMVNMSEEWRENIMEREYGPDEKLPGSGRTPKQKYRAKRGRFIKSKKPSQNETGRQRAQRMAQNYYIGTTKQQYDNFGIGN